MAIKLKTLQLQLFHYRWGIPTGSFKMSQNEALYSVFRFLLMNYLVMCYPRFGMVTPPPMPPSVINPPLFGVSLRSQRSNLSSTSSTDTSKTPPSALVKKTKKTVKLFWKEVRDDPIILAKLQQSGMIWDELNPVSVDTQKLEHLFESRAKDLINKVWTLSQHVSLYAFHMHNGV